MHAAASAGGVPAIAHGPPPAEDAAAALPSNSHSDGGLGRVAQVTEVLRWVQSHPILATVIWVFGKVVSGTNVGNFPPSQRLLTSGGGSTGSTSTTSSSTGGSALKEGRRGGSSGGLKQRVSSRRLSWNDEHGGSLAQYYEDNRPPLDAVATADGELLLRIAGDDAAESAARAAMPPPSAPEGVFLHRSSSTLYYRDIAAADRHEADQSGRPGGPLPACAQASASGGGGGGGGGGGSYSPQWGWYVNMTPPQEHFSGAPGGVAAAAAPHPASSSSGSGGVGTGYASVTAAGRCAGGGLHLPPPPADRPGTCLNESFGRITPHM